MILRYLLWLVIGCSLFYCGYLYKGYSVVYDYKTTYMLSNTGSMLPSYSPESLVDAVDLVGEPLCGHVYIYERDGVSVVHRLVFVGGLGYYFKGDNNDVLDEPVDLGSIKKEVVGIRFQ